MLMQTCILPVKVYMLIDTNEDKEAMTRFTLGDAESYSGNKESGRKAPSYIL